VTPGPPPPQVRDQCGETPSQGFSLPSHVPIPLVVSSRLVSYHGSLIIKPYRRGTTTMMVVRGRVSRESKCKKASPSQPRRLWYRRRRCRGGCDPSISSHPPARPVGWQSLPGSRSRRREHACVCVPREFGIWFVLHSRTVRHCFDVFRTAILSMSPWRASMMHLSRKIREKQSLRVESCIMHARTHSGLGSADGPASHRIAARSPHIRPANNQSPDTQETFRLPRRRSTPQTPTPLSHLSTSVRTLSREAGDAGGDYGETMVPGTHSPSILATTDDDDD
jgi:hypothetical protein